MKPTVADVSEIKRLINDGKDFRHVSKIYPELAGGSFMSIKYGYYKYAGIEPLTQQEVKRIQKQLKHKTKYNMEEQILPIEKPKKTYPRVVQLVIQDEQFEKELRDWLEDKKRHFEKQLALTTLKIIAIQTGDYSDLPESALKDLEELKQRVKNGEDILSEDNDIVKTA